MRTLFSILLSFLFTLSFSQIPEDGDSIYYSPKFCNTADSIEDALTSWAFNGQTGNCYNPSIEMLNALFPGLYILDTYDCCCKVASSPGLEGSWNGFLGGACEAYLDSIGWSSFEDNLAMDENIINQLNGIYIDMYGRQYTIQPKGLSVMNKKKYYRL